MTIDPIIQLLESRGAPYALIGGHALAARGFPRFTVDVDLMTTAAWILDGPVWAELQQQGAAVDRRRGDIDDPLAGVVHLLLPDGTDVDLVLAKYQWEADVVGRAEPMLIRPGLRVPVPLASDLILLKLAAGGSLDLRDAATLLSADRQRLVREVEARLDSVRPDVRRAW
ncbi:MAG: hypothetical protein ACKOEC_15725, partial [Acidimicrobiia bacterium]